MTLPETILDIEAILNGCRSGDWEVRMQISELHTILEFLKELRMIKANDRTAPGSATAEEMRAEEIRARQRYQSEKLNEFLRQYQSAFSDAFTFEELFGKEKQRHKREETFRWESPNKKAWYSVLDVPENSDRPIIEKAYRRLASKYHPDKHPGASAQKLKELNEKLKEVLEAWDTAKGLRGF